MAPSQLEAEARSFAESYATLFALPEASSLEHCGKVAENVSKKYKPGVTFFTNGHISRFEGQAQAAALIESEMKKVIKDGLGVCLLIQDIKTVPYSDTAVTCYLTWKFQPAVGSEFADKPWTFVNIYGYRAATEHGPAGWEYIVRDNEVLEMQNVTGGTFA